MTNPDFSSILSVNSFDEIDAAIEEPLRYYSNKLTDATSKMDTMGIATILIAMHAVAPLISKVIEFESERKNMSDFFAENSEEIVDIVRKSISLLIEKIIYENILEFGQKGD
jgi:hypothetical protein